MNPSKTLKYDVWRVFWYVVPSPNTYTKFWGSWILTGLMRAPSGSVRGGVLLKWGKSGNFILLASLRPTIFNNWFHYSTRIINGRTTFSHPYNSPCHLYATYENLIDTWDHSSELIFTLSSTFSILICTIWHVLDFFFTLLHTHHKTLYHFRYTFRTWTSVLYHSATNKRKTLAQGWGVVTLIYFLFHLASTWKFWFSTISHYFYFQIHY